MKKLLFSIVFIVSILLPFTNINAQSFFDISNFSTTNDDEFLDVEDAFAFNFLQQNNELVINFDVKDGYYLYKHQFQFTPKNAVITPVELPLGTEYDDAYFGLQQIYLSPIDIAINIEQANANSTITVRYQGCAKKGLCYPPITKVIPLDKVLTTSASSDIANALLADNQQVNNNGTTPKTIEKSEQFKLADMLNGDNFFFTLLTFFVGGLLLSFTPCVFPMYPILTGIITGQGSKLSTKRAFSLSFFYVQGMAITYTILGIVVALAGAQFQAMFQHPAVLISLSVLFIFLALSMFGFFNLALPSAWQNKLNAVSSGQKGGSNGGVVIMGAISGLVASPCTTAPLTAALIFIADSGNIVTGATALYALSLGMGLPLLILGSSGGKLLPKAGNWMNVIKNIFGLLLLAVPVFLLERFIPETASNVLWALLLLATGSYFYVMNQQSEKTFAHGLRFAAIFVLLFFGANKLYNVAFPAQVAQSLITTQTNKFIHVNSLSELRLAVDQANNNNKTVMIDLFAEWCVACKEFEALTFPAKSVQNALANTVLIKVDLTDSGSESSIEIMESFDVFGLPSILFFDLSGQELTQQRVTGFMNADKFSAHIKQFF